MTIGAQDGLAQIAAREGELARSLHAQFRRRLTAEDTRDAVADAIAVALSSHTELDGLASEQLEAWVRTRAYRNAIDQIRALDGYAAEKRKAAVSVEDYAETLTGDDVWQGVDDELAERFADGAAAQSLALALERLTPDERRLLRLRHFDGLDVKTIAALLDIHPKKYERLHTRAIGKLRTIFIETTASEHCDPVRALIARSRRAALAPALSAEIAAHVEACEQCRGYEKRSLKLIAALPLPAPALADRVWARIQEFAPNVGSHSESLAAGATGAVGAGAGGTAAGGGILAGLGAKAAVVCGGAAVTATCVGALAVPIVTRDAPERKPPAREAQRQAQRPAPRPAPPPPPAAAAVARTPAKTTPTREPAPSFAPGGTSDLGVESFGTPTSGRSAPPPPPPPATSTFRDGGTSAFSGEFTP